MKSNFFLLSIITYLFFNQFNAVLAQQNDIPKKVDDYISAYVQMNQFGGSILIAKNGHIILKKGFGVASYEYDVKNTPQTKFRIASLTKAFAAVAILQLEERNLLSVDDKLSKFIPDYPNGEVITINHLLTHTSGIPDHTKFEDFKLERRVYHYDILKTIETFKNKPLEFQPGEKFSYSNSNYILIGYIIEKTSQLNFEDYVEQNIFKPLNMDNSGFEHPQKIIKYFAHGYAFKDNEIVKAQYRDMSNSHASGALYSTIEDLYLWDRALYTNKLISKNSLEKMFAICKDNYGYGWGIIDLLNHKMYGHNGEIDGFNANISRFVNDDACIIVLSNFEHAPIGKISTDLAAILFNEKYSIPEIRKTIKIEKNILDSYVGKYELKPNFIFNITQENGSLFCQPTGQGKLELLPISVTDFFLKEVDAKITFTKSENGKIDRLILHQGDKDIPAKRIK